jgi:cyanophycinase
MEKNSTLIIIGGKEDKKDDMLILNEISKRAQNGKLVIATIGSDVPLDVWSDYRIIFRDLGVQNIEHLSVTSIEEARQPELLSILENATVVYLTGGDQLKITTRIGGTPIADRILEIFESGGTIAGTSAGASVMSTTMVIGGENDSSHKIGRAMMAPGLGLISQMIIDQHFAQRGRIGRLLGAVALNPGLLGIGIDEDTSIIVEKQSFRVLGSNAVYVVDGREVIHTNVSQAVKDSTMTIFGVKLHVLGHDDVFDFNTRQPLSELKTSQPEALH